MKPSIMTRFLASIAGVTVAIAATIAGLAYQIVRAIFNLPTALIENGSAGAAFMRQKFEPRQTNAQINAKMLADPRMEECEFIIVADSGKNGDEDRKLPFPKGFLEHVGARHAQKVGIERAKELANRYLAFAALQSVISALKQTAEQEGLTKPTGHITSGEGCP